MTTPYAEIASLDRLVHDPSRLAILAVLESCRSADFLYLLTATGLTKGNLSSHLSKLEEGGLIVIEKGYRGKLPTTRARLTAAGRKRFEAHWRTLTKLERTARPGVNARRKPR